MTYAILSIPAAICEIGILCLAGFSLFRRWEYTFAESASYAVISALMCLSFIFQMAFITGLPMLSVKVEIVLCLLAAGCAVLLRKHLVMGWKIIRNFASDAPVISALLCIAWCVLAIEAAVMAPTPGQWAGLNQILLFQKHSTFFIGEISPGDSIQAFYPVNASILTHLALRFHTHMGIGVLGFLAYLSIGFSTYAIARRYSWPPTAFTVAIIVASMPRLVYHATSPGNEIIPAALGLFCLLALNRTVEQPNLRDMLFLILGLLFGISGEVMCLTFPLILTAISCVILSRRHGVAAWGAMLIRHPLTAISAIFPAVVFSQGWLFLYNALYRGAWVGSPVDFTQNPDGLTGAFANFLRYILESAHFTRLADIVFTWMMGFSLTGIFQKLYDAFVFPVFGNSGATIPFVIQWVTDGSLSWFGPFGFVLILPAVFYTILRGHRRLKAVAIGLASYLYIVSLVAAWEPGNARFLTIFYTCGGCCAAFILPPWRFTKTGKRILRSVSVFLLFYACICNAFF